MSALPRPDLPAGQHQELNDALHELHHQAGWPSLRTLARETGVSHTTVSKTFSAPALPSWGTVELLVEAMSGDANEFHELWLAATSPTDGTGPTAPRIAGRRAELVAVRRHLETDTGLLLVTGEAGMGKTTLVETAARGTEGFVATGHCLPLSTEVPMLPIADVLQAVHDADGGQWLSRALSNAPAYTAAAIAPLAPHAVPDAPDHVRSEAPHRLFTAFAEVLKALAGIRRLTVLVEDLHWADPASLDLLEHVVERGAPVPLLGTWRTGDDSGAAAGKDWFGRVRRHAHTKVVELGPLTRDETLEQLALLGTQDPAQVDRIHARSQGQPLFTEQLAAHAGDEQALPSLLADLLDRRLEGLSGTAWAIARTLGLAERPLTPSTLCRATGATAEELTSHLRELRSRHLLHTAGGDAVQLRHPLLAEAARRRLVAGEATAAYRALAEALAAEPEPEAAEVAAHWLRAAEPEQELRWRIVAARGAMARFDRRQEAEHWRRALEIWPPSRPAEEESAVTYAEAYLAAMEALRTSYQWDLAAEMSDAAEELLGEIDDTLRAELLYRAAAFRGEREGLEVALSMIEEALRLFERLPMAEGHVRALDRKQSLLLARGRFGEARHVAQQAVSAATELGDALLLRDCLMREAWHTALVDSLDDGLACLDRAASESGAGPDPLGDVRRAVFVTDLLLIFDASADDISAAGDAGLAVADEYDIDNFQVQLIRFNVACVLVRAGRLTDAESIIGPTGTEETSTDRWPLRAISALIDAVRGHPRHALDRVDALCRELGDDSDTEIELIVLAGGISCWAGDPGPTLDRLLHGLDVLADTSPVRFVAPGLAMAARCAADLAADGRWQAHEATLGELARRTGILGSPRDTSLAAHALAFGAEMARPSGEDRASTWTDAATLWDRLGRPYDAAYCRWRAAQVVLREGQGTVAARLLRRAAADAREHVPLSEAIAATAAAAR